jgi:hypothetical protein
MTPAADAYLTYLNFQCNQKLSERPFSLFNCLKCQHKNGGSSKKETDGIIYVQQNGHYSLRDTARITAAIA